MILKLHAETPFVKGFTRSIIYDLPRHNYQFISNEINKKLKLCENYKKEILISEWNNEEIKWLSFLLKNEYIFFIPETFKDNFKDINFEWKSASIITSSIIDIANLNDPIDLKFLENLNCKHIALRFFCKKIDNQSLNNFLTNISYGLTFDSISLFFQKNQLNESSFKNLKAKFKNIDKIEFMKRYKTNKYFSPKFIIGINSFSEALNYNLYYNRKIKISINGDVSNGVETNEVFLNMKDCKENFNDYIIDSNLSVLWNINKDMIDVCKDCEFRYMCVDNRIPKKRGDNSYYYETECAYNPYIAKWYNDNDFKSLKDIGIINDTNRFVIDKNKINEINEILWTE